MNNKVFKYNCEKCDYHNNNLSNFKKHLSTAKHRSEKLSNKKVNNLVKNSIVAKIVVNSIKFVIVCGIIKKNAKSRLFQARIILKKRMRSLNK